MKHVLCQAIYQLTVMCTVVFFGHHFLPEELDKATHGRPGSNFPVLNLPIVRSGLEMYGEYSEEELEDTRGNSRHFTYSFCIFVMMQVLNFVNARKIDDTLNTFEGILKSHLFIIIVCTIFVLQISLATLASLPLKLATWVRLERLMVRALDPWDGPLLFLSDCWA